MNKSIYKEALEELTWLLHDEFDESPKRSRLNASQRLNMFKKVVEVLEQAQKQDKLFELYKEYFKLRTLPIIFNTDYYRLLQIENEIKEL